MVTHSQPNNFSGWLLPSLTGCALSARPVFHLLIVCLLLLPACDLFQKSKELGKTPPPTANVEAARAQTAAVADTLRGLAPLINSNADALDDVLPLEMKPLTDPLTDAIRNAGGQVAGAADDLDAVDPLLASAATDVTKIAGERDTANKRTVKAEKRADEAISSGVNKLIAWVVGILWVGGIGLIALAVWLGFTGAIKGAIGLGLSGAALIGGGCLLLLIAEYAVYIGIGAGVVIFAVAGYMAWSRFGLERSRRALEVTTQAIEQSGEAVKPVVARLAKRAGSGVAKLIDKAKNLAEDKT